MHHDNWLYNNNNNNKPIHRNHNAVDQIKCFGKITSQIWRNPNLPSLPYSQTIFICQQHVLQVYQHIHAVTLRMPKIKDETSLIRNHVSFFSIQLTFIKEAIKKKFTKTGDH